MAADIKATIVIPTFNGEEFLRELLRAVENQKFASKFEVLVIDSGSTDRTLSILAEFPKVNLHEIPNHEFGHGKTRNLAAQMAKGEFVVYLTQDAIPAHNYWLEEILRPFAINPKIVGVFGKQIPRPNCMPITKQDVIAAFAGLGPDHLLMLQTKNPRLHSEAIANANSFFSDVNSAVRRDFITKVIPFRDVTYAEDQAFGRDVYDAGYLKCYAPQASVIHSHTYSVKKYFQRIFDEISGLRKTGVKVEPLSYSRIILDGAKASYYDWRFVIRDGQYSKKQKLKWAIKVPAYCIARRLAIRYAAQNHLPQWAKASFSLEGNARRASARAKTTKDSKI